MGKFIARRKIFLLAFPLLLLAATAAFFIAVKSKRPATTAPLVPNTPPPPSQSLVLADAVYADLAVRHELASASVFYFDGDPQDNIAINGTRQWIPASTIKVYVAMYAFNQAAKGNLNLSDLVTVSDNNAVASEIDTPDAPSVQAGQVLSIYELIYKMVAQSDNTAYNTLLDILDRREITKYVHDLGLINSNIGAKLNLDDTQVQSEYQVRGYGENTTTANDFATAFILIKGNRIPGASDLFLILSQQKINNMIPQNLPKDLTIAHKTGDLDPLYHDGGIVVGNDFSYVLAVFTNLGNPNVVAHISELIYKKDPNLVGADIKPKETAEVNPEEQIIDPLVLNPQAQMEVLGESTPSSVPAPQITASDLGITPEDLSLEIEKNALPRLIFPLDSKLRFLVPAWLNLVKMTAIFPSFRVAADMLNLEYQLAEANQYLKNGQEKEAETILAQVDTNLVLATQERAVKGNSNLQNMVKSISEVRFSIMGEELKNLSGDEKIREIKVIADQARNALDKVQPYIPRAVSATSLTQTPVLGQVTANSGGSLVVQTAGGQQILLPAGQEVKMKDLGGKNAQVAQLSSIPVGTTVAVVAETSLSNRIVPAFVLKNVPRQWVAPRPVQVLKVNTRNNTMVISENGVPIQVNITPKTVIKGSDTTISLKDIQVGDSVVVRGTDINVPAKSATGSAAIPTPVPAGASPSAAVVPSPTPAAFIAPTQGSPASSTTQPDIGKPKVIEGKVIQVVEKKSSSEKPKAPSQKPPAATPAPKEVKPGEKKK